MADQTLERIDQLEAAIVELRILDYDTRSDDSTELERRLEQSERIIDIQNVELRELRQVVEGAASRVAEVQAGLEADRIEAAAVPPAEAHASTSSRNADDQLREFETVLIETVTKVNELAQVHQKGGSDARVAATLPKLAARLEETSTQLRKQQSILEMLNARLTNIEGTQGPQGSKSTTPGGLSSLDESTGQPRAEGPRAAHPRQGRFRRR